MTIVFPSILYNKFLYILFLGKAASPWDVNSIDWVPTLHLGHQKFDATAAAAKRSERSERLRCRKKRQLPVNYLQSQFKTPYNIMLYLWVTCNDT